jgi:hypothetical protein
VLEYDRSFGVLKKASDKPKPCGAETYLLQVQRKLATPVR